MSVRLLRDHRGRDVYRVETPSGVVGFIDASIPDAALARLGSKLRRKLRRSKVKVPYVHWVRARRRPVRPPRLRVKRVRRRRRIWRSPVL